MHWNKNTIGFNSQNTEKIERIISFCNREEHSAPLCKSCNMLKILDINRYMKSKCVYRSLFSPRHPGSYLFGVYNGADIYSHCMINDFFLCLYRSPSQLNLIEMVEYVTNYICYSGYLMHLIFRNFSVFKSSQWSNRNVLNSVLFLRCLTEAPLEACKRHDWSVIILWITRITILPCIMCA